MSMSNQAFSVEWTYKGEKYNPTFPIDSYGFIYKLIYDDGKMYIGKKSFWRLKTLQPLKGKKRKRRSMVESDWRKYEGSSKEIPKEVKLISKEIIEFANGKQHLSYLEEKYLHSVGIPINENFYNKNIAGRYFDNVERRAGDWVKYYEKGIEDDGQ